MREAFSRYGEVIDGKQIDSIIIMSFLGFYLGGTNPLNIMLFVARIIMDRETGRSRGFAFITFNSVEEASSAIQALDGQVMQISYSKHYHFMNTIRCSGH